MQSIMRRAAKKVRRLSACPVRRYNYKVCVNVFQVTLSKRRQIWYTVPRIGRKRLGAARQVIYKRAFGVISGLYKHDQKSIMSAHINRIDESSYIRRAETEVRSG